MIDSRQDMTMRRISRGRLIGASLSAMIAAAMGAQLASAQATPGSAQCPVVNNVVTCSGALPDGVAVTTGNHGGLTVSAVTGDMAATNRPVISFRSDAPATTVMLDDTDAVVRLTTAPGPATRNLVGAIQAILPDNGSFSLTSNLDIVAAEPSNSNSNRLQPSGIAVAGEGGTFTIVNSGDIEIRDVGFAPDAASIFVDAFGSDLVTVRNSGDLTHVNSDTDRGIRVAADNRRVEIVNEGDISIQSGIAGTAIELAYQISQFSPPLGGLREVTPHTNSIGGVSYNAAPVMPLESYAVRNSGTIAAPGFGISVDTSQVDQTGSGIAHLGAPDGSVVNDGTIRSIFGIHVAHYGDRSVVNNGRIENFDENEFFGISVLPGFLGQHVPATVRVENSATGVIEYDGTFVSTGIDLRDNPATIVNAGSIVLKGGEGNWGLDIRGFGQQVGLTTIENSGIIDSEGARGRGVSTLFNADATGPSSDTRLLNSGLIEATGADSSALVFTHLDRVVPGGATRGRVSVDLTSTSVVRGGSGAESAGIIFIGGESHNAVNRGLITAASGRGIVGGVAQETVDNSGRIEGSVELAGGDDGVTLRAGAVQIGAMAGGDGTDALLFDIAAGEASATGAILDFESVRKTGGGTITLRDSGTISPGFSFEAGTLFAEGNLGSTAIAAPTGTTLGGSGSVGAVVIADGASVTPGRDGVAGTITVASLDLSGTSILRYDLAAPGVAGGPNDLITVTGPLRLDGTLDINALPGFGTGVYRLIDYGGALTDNGLAIGTAPEQDYEVQTRVAGQVNLVVAEPAGPGPTPPIQFWDGPDTAPDGTIDGGSGTWGGTRTNWTRANGEVNEAWNGNFAVFQGAPGTVTIDPAGISATGLQFAIGGYTVQGGPLTLNAPATVRVGDASAGGSAMTATIASAIEGTGGLVKTDLGTLVLTGANGYTGGTTISSGILQVAADSALGGAGSGLTLDGGTLRLAGGITSGRSVTAGAGGGAIDMQANNLTLSGPLQGAGAITKSGSGTLVLAGASTGFTGRLTTGAGGLRLDGSIGGTLEIGAGTTLSGTGTLNNLIVAGTLSPGNSVGTLTASGNAIFRAGSTFAVELTAAGASDRLNVTGTATVEGGTVAVTALDPELNYTDGASYTFLSAAGGRTGTFAGLSESSAFLDFALGYTATTAFLTVDVVLTFPEVAQTFNQIEAASALREFDVTAGSDSLAVYNAILLLDEAPARAAFNLASGEIYAAVMASSLRRSELVGDRFAARVREAGGPGLGIWGAVSGHDGKVSGDGNGARFSHDGIGADLGIDYRGEGWTLGVGGGWSKGDVELPARLSSADWDGWHIGAYAGLGSGNSGFSATASALHMSGEADVRRAIGFGAIARTARAEADTDTTALSLELRYGFPVGGGWAVGPAGSVGYADTDLDGFTETGPASLALTGNGSSESWTSYAVGGFANLRSERGSIDATLLYARNDDRRAEADLALAGAPGQPFRVRASERGEDMVVLKLSGTYELGGGWTLGGNLRAATGSGEESISGQASLGLRF